jgi:hypothetical protein
MTGILCALVGGGGAAPYTVSTLIVGSGQNNDGGGVVTGDPLLMPSTTYSVAVGAAGGNVSTFGGTSSGFTAFFDGGVFYIEGQGLGTNYQAQVYALGGQAGSRGNGQQGGGSFFNPSYSGTGGIGFNSAITGTTKTYGAGAGGAAGYSIDVYYYNGQYDYNLMTIYDAYAGADGGTGGPNTGFSGQAGVVILSIPTARYTGMVTGSPVVTTSGSNTILQFNSSGSYTA